MILNALIGLAAIFGIFWTLKVNKKWPSIITLGMIAGILLVLIPSGLTLTSGIYLYMVFAALAFAYGLTSKNKTFLARIIICLMAATIFAYWLWTLNHWHGFTLLFPILTLLLGITGIIKKVNVKNELGFLTILIVDAIAIILEHIIKAN